MGFSGMNGDRTKYLENRYTHPEEALRYGLEGNYGQALKYELQALKKFEELGGKTGSVDHPSPELDILGKPQDAKAFARSIIIGPK